MRIGIVNLPSLAVALEAGGHEVISAEDFKPAAHAVLGALRSEPFPVILGNGAGVAGGVESWLRVVSLKKAPIAIIDLSDATTISTDGLPTIARFSAPVNVDDVLIELGEWTDEGATITPDGQVVTVHVAEDLDELPQWDEPESDPVSVPDAPVVDDLDPWGVPAQPQPAPATDPVSPTQTLADDNLDPWGLPMGDAPPVPPIAPAVPAPVADTATRTPVTPQWEPLTVEQTQETVVEEPVTPAPPQVHQAVPLPPTPAPAPPSTVPAPVPPPPSPSTVETDDIFGIDAPPAYAPHREASKRGRLVFSMGGKGGIGKTSTALHLAQFAAEHGPEKYRVIVIDGNRGQGNVSGFLRLRRSGLPTMYDAAASGDPSRALVNPNDIAQHRRPEWGPVDFALMMSPPRGMTDPGLVPNSAYRDAIAFARSIADLVIVDTQITEDSDTSGLFDDVFVPLAADDGYIVMIASEDNESKTDLASRIMHFHSEGVPRDRILIAFNKIQPTSVASVEDALSRLSHIGVPVGVVEVNPEIEASMKLGKLVPGHPNLAKLLPAILQRTTGLPEFYPRDEEPPKGFFARFGRKGR